MCSVSWIIVYHFVLFFVHCTGIACPAIHVLGIFKLIDMSILPKPIVICHTFRLRYQAETVLLWKRLDSQLFSSKSMIEKLMTVNCFCRFTHFRH